MHIMSNCKILEHAFFYENIKSDLIMKESLYNTRVTRKISSFFQK